MARLPRLSGRAARAAFKRAGFEFQRQRGSHMILSKPGFPRALSVPDHRQLADGTLRSLIRKAGLTVEEFLDFL